MAVGSAGRDRRGAPVMRSVAVVGPGRMGLALADALRRSDELAGSDDLRAPSEPPPHPIFSASRRPLCVRAGAARRDCMAVLPGGSRGLPCRRWRIRWPPRAPRPMDARRSICPERSRPTSSLRSMPRGTRWVSSIPGSLAPSTPYRPGPVPRRVLWGDGLARRHADRRRARIVDRRRSRDDPGRPARRSPTPRSRAAPWPSRS
jgi:hypothetical protein